MTQAAFDMPIGPVRATFTEAGALRALRFAAEATDLPKGSPAAELRAQMNAYFSGERRSFDVPLSLEGSSFERRVWAALRAVPYGTTVSYRALAAQLEGPEAAQAVGRACAANPALIVVPCHRVVGIDGALTGYAGGAERKAALLRHEGALLV